MGPTGCPLVQMVAGHFSPGGCATQPSNDTGWCRPMTAVEHEIAAGRVDAVLRRLRRDAWPRLTLSGVAVASRLVHDVR